ncbi:MAG TPA: hypothetical protein VFH73_21585 [Polyangia bacterium]|jgi:hypothetical protein|nr:hypothetical protein [Polyangia bacterium]
MAKRRQGREFWAKVISEFESNGGRESHAAFADRHGVRLTTFRTWLYRLRMQEAPRAKRAVRVLPLTVVGAERSSRELSIDCNGVALRFGTDTDPSYIAALVGALRAC